MQTLPPILTVLASPAGSSSVVPKLLPVSVSLVPPVEKEQTKIECSGVALRAPLVGPLGGLSVCTTGLSYEKDQGALERPETVTTSARLMPSPGGSVHCSDVPEYVAGSTEQLTLLTYTYATWLPNDEPVITSVVPPVVGPLLGATPVMVGSA